jgi:signal transduction histidine kinase
VLTEILEASPGAILALNCNWTVAYANKQAATLFGCDQGQLNGRGLLAVCPEQTMRALWQQLRDARAGYAALTRQQYFAAIPDWFEVHAIPTREHVIVFAQPLYAAGANASDDGRSLALQLNHDLRTALTSINGFSDLLKGAQSADVQTYVGYIAAASDQLLAAFESALAEFRAQLPATKTDAR